MRGVGGCVTKYLLFINVVFNIALGLVHRLLVDNSGQLFVIVAVEGVYILFLGRSIFKGIHKSYVRVASEMVLSLIRIGLAFSFYLTDRFYDTASEFYGMMDWLQYYLFVSYISVYVGAIAVEVGLKVQGGLPVGQMRVLPQK